MIGARLVLYAQLASPIMLAAWYFLTGRASPSVPEAAERRRKSSEHARELVPIKCGECRAPVPLLAREFPCPYCGAEVRPPAEYVNVIELRRESEADLLQAEGAWRRASRISEPRTLLVLRVGMVAWVALVVACAALMLGDWPAAWVLLPMFLGAAQLSAGFSWTKSLAEIRALFPSLPAEGSEPVRTETAICRECGAPIAFASDHLLCGCIYCGADNYRADRTRQTEVEAAVKRRQARTSLLDALRRADERRTATSRAIASIAVMEVFVGAVLGLHALTS